MTAAGIEPVQSSGVKAAEHMLPASDNHPVERPAMRVLGSKANTKNDMENSESVGSRPNRRLQIYQDPVNPSLPTNENSTPWVDLGTEQSRHKENRQEAVRWRGQQLPSSGVRSSRSREKIQVYQDEVLLLSSHWQQ
jgi:hypothetical protein